LTTRSRSSKHRTSVLAQCTARNRPWPPPSFSTSTVCFIPTTCIPSTGGSCGRAGSCLCAHHLWLRPLFGTPRSKSSLVLLRGSDYPDLCNVEYPEGMAAGVRTPGRCWKVKRGTGNCAEWVIRIAREQIRFDILPIATVAANNQQLGSGLRVPPSSAPRGSST
jgi:hypothetical protein